MKAIKTQRYGLYFFIFSCSFSYFSANSSLSLSSNNTTDVGFFVSAAIPSYILLLMYKYGISFS